MIRIMIPLIIILCAILFLVFFGKTNYESLLIGVIAGVCGGSLFPEIRKFNNKRKSIKKGFEAIERDKICSIEELIIAKRKDLDNSLTVRNSPAWIYHISTYDTDKQIKLLISDFERLKINSNWNNFIKGKTVYFNLYSDESFDEEIIKTEQKEY